MKKSTLIAALFVCTGIAQAQTPEKKSVALVTKQTSLGCFYCGDWGWTVGHDVYEDLKTSGKGVYIAVYDLDQGAFGATDNFSNPTGSAIEGSALFSNKEGNPTFKVNGKGSGTGPYPNSYDDRNSIVSAAGQFATSDAAASSAVNYSISGTKVTATAKSKFWTASNGEYYMACYVLEDSIPNVQNGQTGKVVHNAVLRASMTSSSAWGEQIANGAVAANTEATKSYSVDIDAKWQKTKLRVVSVIWKKTAANKYEVVNVASGKPGTTGIKDLTEVSDLSITPNPAKGTVWISCYAKKATALDIRITDNLGRMLYSSSVKATEGANQYQLNTTGLASGVYNLTLSSGTGMISKRLSVLP
ncbi:Omp28-related outer membrane protein [Taibaiella chishuiensis]|uniref:Putative secreted protein (Por secretion system target) n=1 Tax=Taibaiella chishuiensis TaxID=1434707 RepID=A0A2P8CZS3_9BACT|nr:Omp28-related outer membrane protein [Taibaiella chishuiensis]PSK90461.1 putative secreted protein (Por secretion system target) [Taibaiella chishuiensis]